MLFDKFKAYSYNPLSLRTHLLSDVMAMIPARDEGRAISEVARRVSAPGGPVIVVYDGTAKAAADAGAGVLRLTKNPGDIGTVQVGLLCLMKRSTCPERSSRMRQMARAFLRKLSGLGVHNTISGFKVYSRRAAQCVSTPAWATSACLPFCSRPPAATQSTK